jgi:hypothetical protein
MNRHGNKSYINIDRLLPDAKSDHQNDYVNYVNYVNFERYDHLSLIHQTRILYHKYMNVRCDKDKTKKFLLGLSDEEKKCIFEQNEHNNRFEFQFMKHTMYDFSKDYLNFLLEMGVNINENQGVELFTEVIKNYVNKSEIHTLNILAQKQMDIIKFFVDNGADITPKILSICNDGVLSNYLKLKLNERNNKSFISEWMRLNTNE